MKLGDVDISAITLGDYEINEVRLGEVVIWTRGQNAPAGEHLPLERYKEEDSP